MRRKLIKTATTFIDDLLICETVDELWTTFGKMRDGVEKSVLSHPADDQPQEQPCQKNMEPLDSSQIKKLSNPTEYTVGAVTAETDVVMARLDQLTNQVTQLTSVSQ